MLNPEFKAKWLEALRSGKYSQTREVLRRGNTFCCLGVACDVVDPTGWEPAHPSTSLRQPLFFDDYSKVLPPVRVQQVMGGAAFDNGRLSYFTDQLRVLARMNDEGKSFEEIADYIEENL